MQDGSLPLNMILDQVSRDKGIDKDVLIEAIEAAILTALGSVPRAPGGQFDASNAPRQSFPPALPADPSSSPSRQRATRLHPTSRHCAVAVSRGARPTRP